MCEKCIAVTGEGLESRWGVMAEADPWGLLGRAVHSGGFGSVRNKRRMTRHWRRRSKAPCRPGNSQGGREGDRRARFFL